MRKLSEVFKELNNKSNLFEQVFYQNGHLDAIKNNLLTYHITQEQLDDCLENYNLNFIDKFTLTNECFSYDKYQCILYESLFHHDKEKFIEKLEKLNGFIRIDPQAKYSDSSMKDSFVVVFNKNVNLEKLESLMNLFGYYCPGYKNDFENKEGEIAYLFKAFTPKEVKIKDYVYRLVSKRTYDISIRKGLIPRKTTMQPGAEIPRRIYCLTKNVSDKELINLAKTLDTLSKDKPNNILIKIDVAKFNKEHNSDLRFFEDPDCSGDCTIFTKEPIPAKYINIEKKFNY